MTRKNEGSQHAPMFLSTVVVDGASRIALLNLQQKIKEEDYPLIQEDTIFCKSILNEYASKIRVEKPIYTTNQSKALLPIYVSSLVFNGKNYVGGRNKREAEQLVARTVILSVFDSQSGTLMSEIIRSKHKLYAAMDKVKSSCNPQNKVMPVETQSGNNIGVSASKKNEFKVAATSINMPRTAIPEPCSGDSMNNSAIQMHLHEFEKPKQATSHACGAISTPSIFVPPTSEQLIVGSMSGKKRKRNNKKAKKKVGVYRKNYILVLKNSSYH